MTIKIPKKLFAKYQALQAEKNSIQKSIDAVKLSMDLPKNMQRNVGQHIIVDNDGDEIGKVTIFKKDSFVMPACIVSRIS